jgi:hypothetical protein
VNKVQGGAFSPLSLQFISALSETAEPDMFPFSNLFDHYIKNRLSPCASILVANAEDEEDL